jgi:hypothetical protein
MNFQNKSLTIKKIIEMKKAYLFLIALGLVAFVACNKGAKEESTEAVDSTAIEQPVVEEPVAPVVDSPVVEAPVETPAPVKK